MTLHFPENIFIPTTYLNAMSDKNDLGTRSNGQASKRSRKPASTESSKPVTMFLHDEDRIKELFKGLKIADCSRLSVPIEEEDSVDMDAGKCLSCLLIKHGSVTRYKFWTVFMFLCLRYSFFANLGPLCHMSEVNGVSSGQIPFPFSFEHFLSTNSFHEHYILY